LNREGLEIAESPVSAENLGALVTLIDKKTISGKIAKEVFAAMLETGGEPAAIVKEKGLVQISDSGQLEEIVDRVIEENPDPVADFRAGTKKAIGFLVGRVMKATRGKANPKMVNQILQKKLK